MTAEDLQETDGPKRSRRQLLLTALASLGAGSLAVLLARVGGTGPVAGSAQRLLLEPGDLGPDVHVARRAEERETRDGGRAAEVVLAGPGVDLIQSVVVFPTRDAARAALAQIRAQAAAQHDRTRAIPEAGDETVVLYDRRTTSAAFGEGPVLVRLSLEGDPGEARLMSYVEKARAKVVADGREGR